MEIDFTGISIIIPFYDDTPCAKKCLDSIYASSLQLSSEDKEKMEIYLIDDASPQPFIYKESPIDFSYQRLDENGGVGSARNYGARLAKYSHLCFIDSDVVLDETFLTVMFEVLRSRAPKALQGTISKVPANDNPTFFHYYMSISWNIFFTDYWWYGGWSLCTVFSREFFFQLGGFCEQYPDSGGEEFSIGAKLWAEAPGAVLLDERLVFYHHYDTLSVRLKKIFKRSPRLPETLMQHGGIPMRFKLQGGMRVFFSLLLTMLMACAILYPTLAVALYILTGGVFCLFDWRFSRHFCKYHSWQLALVSIFFRQMEYLTVFSGILWGMIKKH